MWELDCEESSAPKNWCFWTVVLEKTLESPLDCKEIESVHSKGDQPWVFFGRNDVKAETPILWPPDAELTHWKRPWCWKGLEAGGEGDDRGWDGWMASPTWWTWVWVNSGSWWWTGRPGVLQFMESQRVGHDWMIELNWCSVRLLGFSDGSVGKNLSAMPKVMGDSGLIPESGRFCEGGNGNPLQYSYLDTTEHSTATTKLLPTLNYLSREKYKVSLLWASDHKIFVNPNTTFRGSFANVLVKSASIIRIENLLFHITLSLCNTLEILLNSLAASWSTEPASPSGLMFFTPYHLLKCVSHPALAKKGLTFSWPWVMWQ